MLRLTVDAIQVNKSASRSKLVDRKSDELSGVDA